MFIAKRKALLVATALLLASCGGGSSDSGSDSSFDDEIDNSVTDTLIQIALGDDNYVPNQAERSCVLAIEDPTTQQIRDCVASN